MKGKTERRSTVMYKWIEHEVGLVGYECAACGAFAVQLDPPAACVTCGCETERVESGEEGAES